MTQSIMSQIMAGHPNWFPNVKPARKPVHRAPSAPQGPTYGPDYAPPGLRVELRWVSGVTPNGLFPRNAPFRLQCPPMAPFTITRGHDSQEYETVYDGTYSNAAAPKLDIITFKTLFMEDNTPWMLNPGMDIDVGRALLENLSGSGEPFNLLCTHKYGVAPEYNGTVTLTDYVHTEDEPYSYYSDLTFKEWRDPITSAAAHGRPRKGGRTWPKHVKLTTTTTLYGLAKKYYGKASMARKIAQANNIKSQDFASPIVRLGSKWKVGHTITLPAPHPPKPKKKPKKVKH